MGTTRALMPRARQDELVVEELQDETLVYDLKRHKARCLNRTAALVWRCCDGQTSVADVAALLEEQLATATDEAVVRNLSTPVRHSWKSIREQSPV